MKKQVKAVIAIVLCLVLSLSALAGCGEKKPGDITTVYGITFTSKNVTYDGTAHSNEISVDTALLGTNTYTVSYVYSKDGATLDGTEFTDAGTYDITATIIVSGEETPYTLTSKLVIAQAEVNLTVGDLFTKAGVSQLPTTPAAMFGAVKLIGSDKFAALGTMKFVVYNGSTKLEDVSTIKAISKTADAYKLTLEWTTAPVNYKVTVTDGKLYVMTAAEYTTATTVKNDIAALPASSTALNEFDYTEMTSFSAAATRIATYYKTFSEVQKLYAGSCDTTAVATMKKSADTRLNATYEIDGESTSEYLIYPFTVDTDFTGTEFTGGTNNFTNVSGNGKTIANLNTYVSGLVANRIPTHKIKKDADNAFIEYDKEVAYGDSFSLTIVVIDTDKNKFDSTMIRNLGLDASQFTMHEFYLGTVKCESYSYGVVASAALDSASNYYKNKYETSGIGVTAAMLGNLTTKYYITVSPLVGEIYDLKFETGNGYANFTDSLSSLSLKSGSTTYYSNTNGTPTSTKFVAGKEYKLTVMPKSGYALDEVEVGTKTYKASDFVNNVLTFTLTKDMVNANQQLVVKVKNIRKYTINVMMGIEGSSRTVRDSDGTGIYTNDYGTFTITNIDFGTNPSVLEGTATTMMVTAANNYVLTGFTMTGKTTSGGVDATVSLLTDDYNWVGKTNTFTFEDAYNYFLPTADTIVIKLVYTQLYNIKLNINDKPVTAATSGMFKSDTYGNIAIIDSNDETITATNKSGSFKINFMTNYGYVVTGVSINGSKSVLFQYKQGSSSAVPYTGATDNLRYMINKINDDGEMILSKDGLGACVNVADLTGISQISAGEPITIDVTVQAFYTISYDNISDSLKHCTQFKGVDGSIIVNSAEKNAFTWGTSTIKEKSELNNTVKLLTEETSKPDSLAGYLARTFFVLEEDWGDSISASVTTKASYTDGTPTVTYKCFVDYIQFGTFKEKDSKSMAEAIEDCVSATAKPGAEVVFYFEAYNEAQ